MFYRGIDPRHPLYEKTDAQGRDAIHWIYEQADRILGETLTRMRPDDRLIVLSDHGFAPFRRAVHLNRWLVDQGYLVLKNGASTSGVGFSAVDWSRSRAYALGLNGIFINRAGREAGGIVEADAVDPIKQEIMQGLPEVVDPESGAPMIKEVYDGAVLYRDDANGDAPDLVVGYLPGYRASWQTTLGAAPRPLVEDNDRKWSGDHCIAPDEVPGVLFTSFQPEAPIPDLPSVADYVRKHWRGQP